MKVSVLVEVTRRQENAFVLHEALSGSERESLSFAESLVQDLTGYGLEVQGDFAPVPLFMRERGVVPSEGQLPNFADFAAPTENPDVPSQTIVIACEVERSGVAALSDRQGVQVWPNSELSLLQDFAGITTANDFGVHPLDLASSRGGLDCRPFRPGVDIITVRELLSVNTIWQEGFRGQNIVVGIIDEGVNGQVYPVVGGYSSSRRRQPGTAPITSHGSMCAADILVAAPAAKIYDYPFLGVPNSGGALQMFQAVLDQRRRDGTPT